MQSPRITSDQPGETGELSSLSLAYPGAMLFWEDNNFSMPFMKNKKGILPVKLYQ